MDKKAFDLTVRAVCGQDASDPVLFAHCVFDVLEQELASLRVALQSDDPEPYNAGQVVFYMRQRVELARDLLEQLRQQKGAA